MGMISPVSGVYIECSTTQLLLYIDFDVGVSRGNSFSELVHSVHDKTYTYIVHYMMCMLEILLNMTQQWFT
jgi:hypothetical protein